MKTNYDDFGPFMDGLDSLDVDYFNQIHCDFLGIGPICMNSFNGDPPCPKRLMQTYGLYAVKEYTPKSKLLNYVKVIDGKAVNFPNGTIELRKGQLVVHENVNKSLTIEVVFKIVKFLDDKWFVEYEGKLYLFLILKCKK